MIAQKCTCDSVSANPYFRSKSSGHAVTLASFTAALLAEGRYNLHNLCKTVTRDGIENLLTVQKNGLIDIAKEREGTYE